jgi:tRNA (guanosine-2'-O-)-methyltransferase
MMQKKNLPLNISTQYVVPEHFKQDVGKVSQVLKSFLTAQRLSKIQNLAAKRSRHVLAVFENTHHAHNISAILRTFDAFGFLDLLFLYSNPQIRFRSGDAIERGASQWLMAKSLNSFNDCAVFLKKNGYKIALVSLPEFSRTAQHYLNDLPAFGSHEIATPQFQNMIGDNKIALIFGSELLGISKEWTSYADFYLFVQMYGFTESLNISVCAGILLQSLREFLERKNKEFLLTPQEKKLIEEYWIAKTCSKAYSYISTRHFELLEWFLFVRSGNFFDLKQ